MTLSIVASFVVGTTGLVMVVDLFGWAIFERSVSGLPENMVRRVFG